MYSNRKWTSIMLLAGTGMVALPLLSPALSAQSPRIIRTQHSQRSLHSLLPEPAAALDEARDLFNAGQDLYDDDKFADAEKKFRQVITRFPKNPVADKANYYLIRTLSQLGKRQEALTLVRGFAKQYPSSKWLEDVQEMQLRLTNQVPVNAEYILLRQSSAALSAAAVESAAKAAPAAAPTRVTPITTIQTATPFYVPGTPPTPPTPPSPPTPFNLYFGPQNNSLDPQVSLQQEIMRAMFNNNAERAIEIATERLKTDPADPVVLSILNMVASSRSAQALPMLLAIARGSTSTKARKDAIFWLGQSRGDKDAIVDTLVGLLPALSDEDSESVTFTLGQIRSDKSVNALAGIARDKSKSEKVRSGALFGISQSRGTNRVSLLEDIYKGNMDSSKIRQQVLFALGQIREPQVVPVLGNIASSDPDIEVRKQAVFALGQNRSPEANQALEKLLLKK